MINRDKAEAYGWTPAEYDRRVNENAESRKQAEQWIADLRENPDLTSMYDVPGDTPVAVRCTQDGRILIELRRGSAVPYGSQRPWRAPRARLKEPRRRLKAAWNMIRHGYDPEGYE